VPIAGVAEPTRAQLDKVLRVGKAVGGDIQEVVIILQLVVKAEANPNLADML